MNLYFERSEQAIVETDLKYGGYCYTIAYNILSNREDWEESVNDTYMAAWKSMHDFMGIDPELETIEEWDYTTKRWHAGSFQQRWIPLCLDGRSAQ